MFFFNLAAKAFIWSPFGSVISKFGAATHLLRDPPQVVQREIDEHKRTVLVVSKADLTIKYENVTVRLISRIMLFSMFSGPLKLLRQKKVKWIRGRSFGIRQMSGSPGFSRSRPSMSPSSISWTRICPGLQSEQLKREVSVAAYLTWQL